MMAVGDAPSVGASPWPGLAEWVEAISRLGGWRPGRDCGFDRHDRAAEDECPLARSELQERYGYPELTPARKAKVLGLNAARVYGIENRITTVCRFAPADLAGARGSTPRGTALYGPRTRRQFLALALSSS